MMTASTTPIPETMDGLKRQNSAYRTLCASLESQMAHYEKQRRQWWEATQTLDSERDANAKLTARIELLEEALSRIVNLSPAVTHGWAIDARKIAQNALSES